MGRFSNELVDDAFADLGGIMDIDEARLVIRGGGDGSGEATAPDAATTAIASALATKYGMRITTAAVEFWGHSEWTPEPGEVSVFTWERHA